MYTLKKDIEKYKDMYKYHYKLLDKLIRYCLTLLKENIKDDNDIKYLNSLMIECKKIFISLDTLIFSNDNCFNNLFKENEKYILVNDNNDIWKDIKENYDMLVKLFIK